MLNFWGVQYCKWWVFWNQVTLLRDLGMISMLRMCKKSFEAWNWSICRYPPQAPTGITSLRDQLVCLDLKGCILEDHPRTCKWLGSPLFLSQGKAIWKGNNPILRGRKLTMVIDHLLTGMILQVITLDFLDLLLRWWEKKHIPKWLVCFIVIYQSRIRKKITN